MSSLPVTGTPSGSRWLFGPFPDLLLGCGGLYALLFGLLVLLGPAIRQGQPTVLFPLLTLFLGMAHYGATLLRVYEHRRERRSYVVFSLWATLLVVGTFVAGLWIPIVATVLVTLYLTWSPWHYTGQNYGIAVMMLKRSGVEFDGTDKRWLYASFTLSYALVFVIMHGADGSADGSAYAAAPAIRFQPLGIPVAVLAVIVPALGAAYLVSLGVVSMRLLRRASPSMLAPAALLWVTQILWFSLPFLLLYSGIRFARVEALDWDFRTHYFVWIAGGHFLQYLWVTSYFARKTENWHGFGIWYAKVLAAGAAVWTLPTLILGPLGMGPLSMDLGLALLVLSAVNVHHFILDGAIWKLRGRIAEVLVRSQTEAAVAIERSTFATFARSAVWAACVFGVFLSIFQVFEKETLIRASRQQDLVTMRVAWDRLGWFGLDEAGGRLRLGNKFFRSGDVLAARSQFERSLELGSLQNAWIGLAQSYIRQSEWDVAARTAERGLADWPEDVSLLVRGALAWRNAGEPERALGLIERAEALAPKDASVREESAALGAALEQKRSVPQSP